jgi:hypothetical protein
MIKATDLATTEVFTKLQLLEIGMEKSGKSWCAATAPKPILFFDFDLRANALAGKKGVYAITFSEPDSSQQPQAFVEFLDVLTKLEGGADLRQLGIPNVDAGVKPVTIVPDSITTLARAVNRYALYANNDIRRRITFGGKFSVDFVKSFDGWNAEMTTVEQAILRCLAMPYHLITTLHEEEEKSEMSTPEKKQFTGKIGPFPARYQLLFKYFNEIWHFANMPDKKAPASTIFKPYAQVKPDYRSPWCCTNLRGLEQFEEPDIEAMIKKHVAAMK